MKVILYCKNCEDTYERELDLDMIEITIDVPNSEYIFRTVCETCESDIENRMDASKIIQ